MTGWLSSNLTLDHGFALALALSTGLLWWETRRLAQAQRDQSRDLTRSVEAAERAAHAATKSAEIAEKALIGIERPILRIEPLTWGPPLPLPGESTDELYRPKVTFKLENYGKVAAVLHACVAEIRAVESGDEGLAVPIPSEAELSNPPLSWDLLDSTHLLPPGHSINMTCEGFIEISDERLKAMRSGRSRRWLFLFGLLQYTDVLEIDREKGFCYFFSPQEGETGRWRVTDKPECNFDRIADKRGDGTPELGGHTYLR